MSASEKSDPGHPGSVAEQPLSESHETTNALVEAVRAELLVLVQGNLQENLRQIAEVTKHAETLLLSLQGPEARHVKDAPQNTQSNYPGAVTGFSAGTFSTGSAMMNLNPYRNPEQFGAQAIRQLVSLVPEMIAAKSNSPDKLMKAIALAKKEGHHEIAAALTRRLLGEDTKADMKADVVEGAQAGHVHGDCGVPKKNGAAPRLAAAIDDAGVQP